MFNFNNVQSWMQMKAVWGGPSRVITRTFAKNGFEWNLLSKENWAEFELQTIIFDSHECGLLFDYIDERNYSIITYSKFSDNLIVGRMIRGAPIMIGMIPMPIKGGVWMPRIKVNSKDIKLYFGSQLLTTFKMPFRPKSSKFGIFIKEVKGEKRPIFGNISVKGRTESGDYKVIRNITDNDRNYPPVLILIYLSFLGAVFSFAKFVSMIMNFELDAFKIRKGHFEDWIYNFILIFVSGILFVRTIQVFGALDYKSFKIIMLWKSLGVCFAGYMIYILLAKLYSKRIGGFSTPMYFLFFSILMYFVTLFNLMYFKINDQSYLLIVTVLLLIPVVVSFFKKQDNKIERKSSGAWFNITNISLLIWFVYIVMYGMENNFFIGRTFFSDEGNLWANSAQDMINFGVLKGHLGTYGGLATQSFGTPFFNALPSLILGAKLPRAVFFMPAVIIPILWLMIFNIVKKNKWAFLFLFLAMVSSFGKMAWTTHVFFRAVFSDALFVTYLLLMVMELRRMINRSSISVYEFLGFSLIAGLYPNIRSTGALYGFALFVVLAVFYLKKNKVNVKTVLLAAVGFTLVKMPFSVWKVFRGSQELQSVLTKVGLRYSEFSVAWLQKVGAQFWFDHSISIYFMIIAVVIIMLTYKRKDYSYGFMPVFLFATVVIYFALIQTQQFNCEGSVVRYMLPPIIVSFYLGAIGFDVMVKKILR
ncbi:MAG: hypothetical protein KKD07_02475, partial [Candidatus Omnitrophica bacterium]|nr:hypothetical protein [Candidatus Omnitrophota bacterium]